MFKKIYLFIFLITPFFSGAFDLSNIQTERGLEMRISPEFPESNNVVFVEIYSLSFNIDKSENFFYIDNILQKNGKGIKNFSFISNPEKQTTSLKIVSISQEGREFFLEKEISGSSLDLLYEPLNTYTPNFYKGRSLEISNSDIIFNAEASFYKNGEKLNPNELVYNWYLNKNFDLNNSGYGKKTFQTETKPWPRETEVEVEVRDLLDEIILKKKIKLIPEENSEIIFYKTNPETGFFLKDPFLSGLVFSYEKDTLIQAVPYYFSGIKNQNKTDFIWLLGNKKTEAFGEDRDKINIVNGFSEKTEIGVSLEIKNKEKFFQFGRGSFSLVLDNFEKTNLNFFNQSNTEFINNPNQGIFGL